MVKQTKWQLPSRFDKPTRWMAVAILVVLVVFGIKTALDTWMDNRMKKSCVVGGVRFYDGERVPCGKGDECNSCRCDKGMIFRTMALCMQPREPPEPPPSWLQRQGQ